MEKQDIIKNVELKQFSETLSNLSEMWKRVCQEQIDNIESIMKEDEEKIPFRLIQVSEYGTDGMMPIEGQCCPYELKDGYDSHGPSCVSGSGGSICSGFFGSITVNGKDYVKCIMSKNGV